MSGAPLDARATEERGLFESHESFINGVMLPNVFALLCPLVVGSFQSVGVVFVDKTMLVTLVSACLVTIAYSISLGWLKGIYERHVLYNFLAHGVTLCLGCMVFRADLFGTLMLPLSFVALAHSFWPLPSRAITIKILVAATALIFAAALVLMFREPETLKGLGVGLLVFLTSALFCLLRPGAVSRGAPQSARISNSLQSLIGPHHEQEIHNIYAQCRLNIAREIAAEFVWRLPLLALTIGSGVFWLGYSSSRVVPSFALGWVAIAAIFLTGMFGMLMGATISGVYQVSFLVSLAAYSWILLGFFHQVGPSALFQGGLLVVIVLTSSFPWDRRWLTSMLLLYLLVGGAIVLGHPYQLPYFLLLLIALLISLRLGLSSRVSVLAKVILPIMIHLCNTLTSARTVIRLFSWLYCWLVDASRVLVTVGVAEGFTVGPNVGTAVSVVDPVFLSKLVQLARARGKSDFILSFEKDLGPQFLTPCVDWFDYVPKYLIVSELNAVLDGREERISVFVPLSNSTYLAGLDQLVRAATSVASIVRNSLQASRSRLLSSDVLLSTQRSMASQAEDIDELVHVANNVAQEISSKMETLKADSVLSAKSELREVVQGVQEAISDLSIGVSDVQWGREIAKLRSDTPTHRCGLDEFLEGHVSRFRRWCGRRGIFAQIDLAAQARSLSAVCLSPEYFGAALRSLARAFLKASKRGDKLTLSLDIQGSTLLIGLRADSVAKLAQLDKKLYAIFSAYFSAAGCKTEVKESPLSIFVEVPVAASSASAGPQSGKQVAWMMIVDDTPEVLNFYARVAEALGLKFYSADSVAAAKQVVAAHGVPELLLTDIQLGDGSGLDLLKALKRESGGQMLSIVVSGKVDAGIAAEVRAAGGDRHLVKPVGRKRLFEVIKELSARSV